MENDVDPRRTVTRTKGSTYPLSLGVSLPIPTPVLELGLGVLIARVPRITTREITLLRLARPDVAAAPSPVPNATVTPSKKVETVDAFLLPSFLTPPWLGGKLLSRSG